jgi:chromosome segregation ATPase
VLDPATYKAQHDALKASILKYERLATEESQNMGTYSTKIGKLKDDIKVLGSKLSSCETSLRKFEDKHDKEKKLLSKVSAAGGSFNVAIAHARSQTRSIAGYASTVVFARQQATKLDAILTGGQYSAAARHVEDAADAVRAQVKKLQNKVDGLKDDQRTFKEDITTKTSELKALERKHEDSRSNHASYTAKLADLKSQLRQLEANQGI